MGELRIRLRRYKKNLKKLKEIEITRKSYIQLMLDIMNFSGSEEFWEEFLTEIPDEEFKMFFDQLSMIIQKNNNWLSNVLSVENKKVILNELLFRNKYHICPYCNIHTEKDKDNLVIEKESNPPQMVKYCRFCGKEYDRTDLNNKEF